MVLIPVMVVDRDWTGEMFYSRRGGVLLRDYVICVVLVKIQQQLTPPHSRLQWINGRIVKVRGLVLAQT